MQVANSKNQVRNRGRIANAFDIKGAGDGIHIYLAVKIANFNAEGMFAKFPEIKAYANNHGKLGMEAGKVAGNNRIKSSHNGQLAPVLLGKVTKSKKFYFHLMSVPYNTK